MLERGKGSGQVRRLALALAVAVLAVAAVACGNGDSVAPLPGTALDGTAAPAFALTNQDGRQVSLAALRGTVVLLTFLYTSCPDSCPLTAEKLKQTLAHLGDAETRVTVVAISVDPEHDDQAAAATFTKLHGMPEQHWHYLTGTAAQLAPVWASYHIAADAITGAGTMGASRVGHTEAIYVIDAQGRERSLLRGDFDPVTLAKAVRDLVRQH